LAALKELKLLRTQLFSNEMVTRLAEVRKELGVISRSFWVDTPHIVDVWASISWLDHALHARINAKFLEACPIQATTNNFDKKFAVYLKSIQGRLDKNRWCPYNERRLGSLYSISHHYVTSLNRQHFPPFITHRNCSESSCTANATDLEAFQTRHVEENCLCSHLNVSSSDIAKVISEGSFPLIELRISANQPQRRRGGEAIAKSSDSIELHIVPWKPSKDYTAISHVWSHGLGNPRSNGLPSCQLGMLLEAVSRTSRARQGTRHIWIDTLCIPVSADFAAQRRTSIDKMGLIYSAASSVLVLDYELQRIPIKTMSRMQILAHLLTCSWMERAWTFNEGSLSRSCFFQFADGIFDSKHINDIQIPMKKPKTLAKCLAYYVELNLSMNLISQFNTTKAGRDHDGFLLIHNDLENHVYYTFMHSWNVLGSRSTTQPEDLVVILANLRGINVSRLFDFAPEERLAALIAFQHYVPFSFLSTPNRSKYTVSSPFSINDDNAVQI
jgi:Heterokaryon incompatibility protein (HET)